jgi:hypothetical protein
VVRHDRGFHDPHATTPIWRWPRDVMCGCFRPRSLVSFPNDFGAALLEHPSSLKAGVPRRLSGHAWAAEIGRSIVTNGYGDPATRTALLIPITIATALFPMLVTSCAQFNFNRILLPGRLRLNRRGRQPLEIPVGVSAPWRGRKLAQLRTLRSMFDGRPDHQPLLSTTNLVEPCRKSPTRVNEPMHPSRIRRSGKRLFRAEILYGDLSEDKILGSRRRTR